MINIRLLLIVMIQEPGVHSHHYILLRLPDTNLLMMVHKPNILLPS